MDISHLTNNTQLIGLINLLLVAGVILRAIAYSRKGIMFYVANMASLAISFILWPIISPIVSHFITSNHNLMELFNSISQGIIAIGTTQVKLPETMYFLNSTISHGGDLAASHLVNIIIRIVCFVATLGLARLVIGMCFDISSMRVMRGNNPIGLLNKILGFIYGLIVQFVIIWIVTSILFLFSSFPICNMILQWIIKIPFIGTMYSINPFFLFIH